MNIDAGKPHTFASRNSHDEKYRHAAVACYKTLMRTNPDVC